MEKYSAIYMRVSTRQQDTEAQKPDLERWAKAHDGPVKWFTDKFTGKTMDRPGMNRLMAAIRAGEVSTVVVWRLDRLGRTAKGLTALFEELCERKVNLISDKDGLNLSTPAGRLMANVLASVASYETEIRAERILAGQQAARAASQNWGGSKKGRLLTVTPEQVDAIKRMAAAGENVTAIARATGLSRPTVYRIKSS